MMVNGSIALILGLLLGLGPALAQEGDPVKGDPRAAVPGGKMAFPGIKKPGELADLIAYLKTH